jgi:hypothetical protein
MSNGASPGKGQEIGISGAEGLEEGERVGDAVGLVVGEEVGQYPGDCFPLDSAAQHPHLSMESFGLSFAAGFTQVVLYCVAPFLVCAMQTAMKSLPFLLAQTSGLDELHFSYVSGLSTGAWLGSGVMVGATVVVGDAVGLVVGEAVGQYPGDFFPLDSSTQHPHF